MSPGADVALLTDDRYESIDADEGDDYVLNIFRDDRLLQDALFRLGVSSRRVSWSRPDVDWSRFRLAVFRTTWDYFDHFPRFASWLREVAGRTSLCNEADLLWWDLDKHYLADLAARGVPVVASRFIERGETLDLADLLEETGWSDAVLKPCVSGAARHTYRVDRGSAAEVEPIARTLLLEESLLLQPFQRNIQGEGEVSLMLVSGRVTHAVRKAARPGDFRVQDDHGGTVHPHRATAEEVALAERAVAACPTAPVYARVDMVRDNAGHLAVMELELIEPELWLREHPPAATALADAIATVLEAVPARAC